MSKDKYTIHKCTKAEAFKVLEHNHYLSKVSKGFKSGDNYALYFEGDIVGVAIFTGLPVPELAKGMYGLERDDQEGMFELSRLCLDPLHQKLEHNLASWFLSKSIKLLRSDRFVRSILSYADADYHNGTVYAACNFKYYGLTAPKKDFYIKSGLSFVKHSRGSVKGLDGEWRPRSRKHRFVFTFDKALEIKWVECKWRRSHDKKV